MQDDTEARDAAGPAGADSASADEVRRRAARRKALDALFGEVLPDITSDEADRGERGGGSERWYTENRPPHHG